MINQFLKVGGVTTLGDFYKKFPKQVDFDNYVKTKYGGGGINAYANGGSYRTYQGDVGGSTVTALPRRADYMDNEEQYQADMDSYVQSLGTGASNNAVAQPFVGPVIPSYVQNMGTSAAEQSAGQSLGNPYSGVSIVDFLKNQGKAADLGNRKKLAEAIGISGYTGKASENTKILKVLQSSPELLDSYPNGPTSGGKSGGKSSGGRKKLSKPASNFYDDMINQGETIEDMTARQAEENPYIMAPRYQPSEIPQNSFLFPNGASGQSGQPDDDGNNPLPFIAAGAGAAGLGYAAYKMFGKKGLASLKQLGYTPAEAMKLLEYTRGLPPSTTQMKQIVQGAGPEIVRSITQRGAYTIEELKRLMQIDPEAAQKIAVKYPKFAKETVSSVKAAAPTVQQMAQEFANIGNSKKAASTPGMFENIIKEAKNSGLIKDFSKLYKWFSKIRKLEHGGEADDLEMLHNYYKLNYLQDGGYMDDGDAYMNYGNYSHGGYYGNVPQHGNPGVYADGYSGTSSGGQYFQEGGAFVPSYGDSAYGLPQYNWGANYQEGGMAPEGMAPQGPPPQQPSEGGGIDPQQVMQEVAQMLQQGAQPEQIMQQLVQEGVPEEIAQQIIQQVIQQMQGGQAEQQGPPQQMYGGYAKGGISAGQEMDVSPAQMEALRQQGYKFDII